MNIRWISLLAVSLLLVTALPSAPASGAALTVRLNYEGSAILAHSSPTEDCGASAIKKLGVVCVAVPKNAHTMDFDITDLSAMAVGGTYYLYDATGQFAGSGTHCDGKVVSVGNAALAVIRLEAVNGPIVCAAAGELSQSAATKGFIDIQFG